MTILKWLRHRSRRRARELINTRGLGCALLVVLWRIIVQQSLAKGRSSMNMTRLVLTLVVVGTASPVLRAQSSDTTPRATATPRPIMDPYFKSVRYGRDQIPDIDEQNLLEIVFEDLPNDIKGQMHSWLAFTIGSDLNPQSKGWMHEPERTKVRVYAAREPAEDDVVEYRWEHEGREIRVVATRNALRFDFDLTAIERDQRLAAYGRRPIDRVKGWLPEILRLEGQDRYEQEYQVDLNWPDELADGVEFSSAPDQDLNRLTQWHRRVDGFVHENVLSILIYKKPAQLMHFQDGSKWFPDDFRAEIHARVRNLPDPPSERQSDDD